MFKISANVQKYIDHHHPKIGIIAPSLDSVPSRQGNAIYCLTEDIVRYSTLEIVVFSIYKEEMPASPIQNKIIYHSNPPKKRIHHRILGDGLCKRLYGVSRTEDFNIVRNVVKLAESIGLECLMIEDSSSLLIGALKNSKNNLKFILHQHSNALLTLKERQWNKVQNKLSEIVFVSKSSKNSVEKIFGDIKTASSVIYNGINEEHFTHNEAIFKKDDSCFELLYVGRIEKSKGVLELVKSISLVEHNVKLRVIGDLKPIFGRDDEYLEAIHTIERKSNGKIILVGLVDQSSIKSYYQKADLVIVPSLGKEGLPKVITEAVMMGVPILASDRGGSKEIIENGVNGYIITDPIEERSISKTIMKGIENVDVLKKGAAIKKKKFSEIFSAKYMAHQFDVLFSRVIEL